MTYHPYMPAGRTPADPAEDARAAEDAAELRYATRHRCRHRRDKILGLVACLTCGGRVNLPAYVCGLHLVKCVELRRPVATDILWCHTCPDRAVQPRDA